MNRSFVAACITLLLAALLLGSSGTTSAEDTVLFDFEDAGDLAKWSPLKLDDPKLPGAGEPETKLELSTEGVTSGKRGLKLTFAGGRTPTVTAASPVADWTRYRAFRADVTASRTCLVVFRALSETSKRGRSYNEGVSRWEKAARLEPGMNAVVGYTPRTAPYKKVVTFEIYMLNPREGESITIDNIRLDTGRPAETTSFNDALAAPVRKNAAPEGGYRVLGTELAVKDVDDLADRLKDTWKKPDDRGVEEVEAAFRAEYDALKKTHPRAVLVVFRDGQNGYDPANPDKVFTGWTDAGTPSHLPMALTLACFSNSGRSERIETCFRNRPGFLRVDLSGIPRDADVLAARLVVVRAVNMGNNWETKPTLFVAEPCNRPWAETEVNVFEYAKGHFWNDYAAGTWGDDGDCTAVLLAHGPGGGRTSSWDFTHAVRWWTNEGHPNHGFILYGAPKYVDYLNILSREHREVKHRPALMVVYEPKP